MSVPNLPNITPAITIDLESVICLLMSSIAMEELGLSNIINTEGEQMQYILGQLPGMVPPSPPTVSELLAINESIRQTLNTTMKNEMFLHSKLETIMSLLNYTSATGGTGTAPPIDDSPDSTSAAAPTFTSTNAFAANTTGQMIEIENSGAVLSLPENQVLNDITTNSTSTVFTVPTTADYFISYTVNVKLETGEYIALTIDDEVFAPGILMSAGEATCYHRTVIVPLEEGSQISLKIFGDSRVTNLIEGAGATLSIVMLG